MDKYIGKTLDGRYEIQELIGIGGMANVYHCYDLSNDREVAIKVLKDEFLNNEDFIRRFKNESKAIAILSHPNIVKVIDVSFGDVIQYIVMEYIDGITLKEYISLKNVISWKETLHLTTQILRALQHAHENGIIHRDIKPQNIMLMQDGTIKVTDFGIARFSSNSTRTMTEHAIGSVHYIAPEQAKGEPADGKADIYSVGVMMYEMLTGKLPFEADNAVSVALMQLQNTPEKPRDINPGIPQGLEQITIKAMQKNKLDRYQSARYMLNDIERFRLNPSIVFSYACFEDDIPTKHAENRTVKTIPQKEVYDDNFNGTDSEDDPDSFDYYEEEELQPKTSITVIKGVAVAAVIIFLVFGGLSLMKSWKEVQVKDVDVPDYVGKLFSQVNTPSQNPDNFIFKCESDYDPDQDMGIILGQDPVSGSKKVRQGSVITLTVNGQDSNVRVPDILSESETFATQVMSSKNLIPQILYVNDNKSPIGCVVNVFPNPGTSINIGSTVYIFVAKAITKEYVVIPNVEGLLFSDAKEILEGKGFVVDQDYDMESMKPKDEVLRQTPLEGGVVEKGFTVLLLLSNEKKLEHEFDLVVPLPSSEERMVDVQVFVDGVLDEANSKNVVPQYIGGQYRVSLKGSRTDVTVIVHIDNIKYRQYLVNFQTRSYELTYEAPFPTTEPPTTEPPTEPPTEPLETDPVVEPSTDPPDEFPTVMT